MVNIKNILLGIWKVVIKVHFCYFSFSVSIKVMASSAAENKDEVRKAQYYFTHLIISVNSFKNRLDKYWANQEFVFNFNSELMGTGGLPVCT